MAIIGGNPDKKANPYDRRHFYLEAARANNIKVKEEWIIPSLFTEADGRRAADELLKLSHIPDTIACMNDIVAAGVLHELHKENIKVPEDIMLTGFDGHFVAETVYPSVTGITFDYPAYAQTIFDEFISRSKGNEASVKGLSYIKVVIRNSTKRTSKIV